MADGGSSTPTSPSRSSWTAASRPRPIFSREDGAVGKPSSQLANRALYLLRVTAETINIGKGARHASGHPEGHPLSVVRHRGRGCREFLRFDLQELEDRKRQSLRQGGP